MKTIATTFPFLLSVIALVGFNSLVLAESPKNTQVTSPNETSPPSDSSTYELTGSDVSNNPSTPQATLRAPAGEGVLFKFDNGIQLYPSLTIGFGHNDNLSSVATNQIGSSATNVAPKLLAELNHRGDRYTAQVAVDSMTYEASMPDNINSSRVGVAGEHIFNARTRGGWTAEVVNMTDARGANGRPVTAEASRYHTNNLKGNFAYGALDAIGRLEFDLGNQDKIYDNTGTSAEDLSTRNYAGRVFYRIGTRTLLLVEASGSRMNYVSPLSTLNSSERRYFAGLTWEATAATTGTVKIGQLTKDFDLSTKNGASSASWDASVNWKPLTYCGFDFLSSRSTSETSGYGDFIINQNTNVSWSYQWNTKLSSGLSLGQANTEFRGTSRLDSALNVGIKLNYAVFRRVTTGIAFSSTDSTSNIAGNEFNRNSIMFTLGFTL